MITSILVVNPGSTSTKLAVYRGHRQVIEWNRNHLGEEDDPSENIWDIARRRLADIRKDLDEKGYDPSGFDVVVARGGLLKPLKGGVYRVNEKMVEDLVSCRYGRHLSNIGAVMARILIDRSSEAYIVNPVVVDELSDVARVSGHPDIERKSVFHALSQKAVAAQAAAKLHKTYDEARLIVVHAGGGVSVGAHILGRVVDVNNALDGDGPFSPERAGSLPMLQFYRYAHDRKMTPETAAHELTRRSGLKAYLGTSDCREIEERIGRKDPQADLYYRAFVYQVAKEVGALAAAVFRGQVDAIVLTGGIAAGSYFRRWLKAYVGFLGPVIAYPDTSEMDALAMGALDAFEGRIRVRNYR